MTQGRTPQERATHLRMAEIVVGALAALLAVLCLVGAVASAYGAERCSNGTPVVIGTDKCPPHAEGCFVGGVVHASSTALKIHECAHSEGMYHTPWVRVAASYNCAIVTGAGGGLLYGQLLCQRIEWNAITGLVDVNSPIYIEDDPRMKHWTRERLDAGDGS